MKYRELIRALGMAAGLAVSLAPPSAVAALSAYPAPAMTVADCTGGRIWMMSGNGLPTCDFYVPPPPVQPPAAAYPFVYAASLFMFDIGQVKYVTKVERVTGSGGWQIASQVNSNYYGPPLYFPWGSGDLSFVWNGGAPSPPSDLNDAMQWFAGQGCRVLTMDSSIQSLVNDAVSANGWPSGASLSIMSTWPPTPRWGGSAWINYAACPSAVM